MDVALLITCLSDTFAPRVGVAVVRVLRHFGCTVHFPEAQSCCGQPAHNNGFNREATALARRTVDAFEPFEYVVTPSGSCATMVIEQFPKLLADDQAYAQRAQRMARRTHEFAGFLRDVLKVDLSRIDVSPAGPLTYHYSCHMRGICPVERSARDVGTLRGVDYRPLEGIEQCCGFGGAFNTLYPDISAAMTRDKLECIAASGAATVVSNETGCTLTMQGLARRNGQAVAFKHLAEVLAEALGLMDDAS